VGGGTKKPILKSGQPKRLTEGLTSMNRSEKDRGGWFNTRRTPKVGAKWSLKDLIPHTGGRKKEEMFQQRSLIFYIRKNVREKITGARGSLQLLEKNPTIQRICR